MRLNLHFEGLRGERLGELQDVVSRLHCIRHAAVADPWVVQHQPRQHLWAESHPHTRPCSLTDQTLQVLPMHLTCYKGIYRCEVDARLVLAR